MQLKVVRYGFGPKATIGKLYINDVFECYTLEDVDRHLESGGVKIQNETAMPRGLYDVIIDYSNHFGKDLPHILNVPQFVGIRIHPGNDDTATEGCLLLGKSVVNDDFISESKLDFNAFFDKLKAALNNGETVTIEIT
jgi:hypothetical protein